METFVYEPGTQRRFKSQRFESSKLYQPSINQNAMGYSLVNAPQGFVLVLKKLKPVCSLCLQLFLSEQMFIISSQP